MPEEQNFHHTALSEARITENANLSDIFSFEFETNESPFLLSNAAANEQKAIMAMYTEAEVKGKAIRLILDTPVFEFELEEEKPIIETFMALGSTSNWANEIEQQYFSTNDSLETKEPVTTG
ncbi:hypothetical protein G9A89_008718 [Geosiphon pyriformis]|nr:hypothetical protein G9A89_008718 [Geosiphon pyriformis]